MNDGFIDSDLLNVRDDPPFFQISPWDMTISRLCIINMQVESPVFLGMALERLLLFQGDPTVTFHFKQSNGSTNKVVLYNIHAKQAGSSAILWEDFLALPRERCRRLKPTMSIREIIEQTDLDNRGELLRLIDWHLARQETKPIPGGWIE